MKLFCKHNYVLFFNISYREIATDKRYHNITLVCEKCHRLKPLVRFATYQNSSIT